MNNDKSLTRQDIELFMMAQFIDVINVFEKYETIDEVKKDVKARKQIYLNYIKQIQEPMEFVTLNLYDKNIDDKLKKCEDAYSDSTEYKIAIQKLKVASNTLIEKLDDTEKEKLKEINNLIYEICDFKTHLAYKIRSNRWYQDQRKMYLIKQLAIVKLLPVFRNLIKYKIKN